MDHSQKEFYCLTPIFVTFSAVKIFPHLTLEKQTLTVRSCDPAKAVITLVISR